MRSSSAGLVAVEVMVCGVSVILCPLTAVSAGRDGRDRAARKACLEGDHVRGVSLLADLFLDTKDATYIYNQGRCLEQNGRFADAIFRFQEYLRVGGVKGRAGDREDAERHIADCQAQIAKQQPQAPASSSVATRPPVADVTAQAEVVVVSPAGAMRMDAPIQKPGRRGAAVRVAGLATAGVGLVGIITGVVFNVKANSIVDGYSARGSYTASRESNRGTYETIGWVGYGVGSACIATGALLYFWGRDPGDGISPSVALVPALGMQSVGAAVSGAF